MKKLVASIASLFVVSVVTYSQAQFLPPQSYPVGVSPFNLVAGDFNNDGTLDLLVPRLSNNGRAGFLSLLTGTGGGSFAPYQSFNEPIAPEWAAVGDFNQDGNLDAVTPDLKGHVAVFIGDGQGGFAAPVIYATTPASAFVSVADLDKDGKLDIVVAEDRVDPAGNNIVILFGNGDGTFGREVRVQVGAGPDYVAIADVNGDGIPDLVAANHGASTVSVLLGKGNGTFRHHVDYPASYLPEGIAVGDFNHDGKLDLAVADAGKTPQGSDKGRVSLLLGNGDGTFQGEQFLDAGAFPYGIGTVDFNHDGNLDLAITNGGDNTLGVFFGKGDGTFQAPIGYATDLGPLGLIVGDLNDDGSPDIAVANRTAGTVDVFLNAGPP